MDSRLAEILAMLIEDYISTAEPVGSQTLVQGHRLAVSPATVRNWFSELEDDGWLLQPHASAGRVPSEAAFHWYVENRLGEARSRSRERALLRQSAAGANDAVSKAKACAKVCSEAVGSAAIVGSSRSDSYYTGLTALFRQPEFSDWSRVVGMSSILDRLDERLQALRKRAYERPTVLLGADCPFGSACGSVILNLPVSGAVLVLLGPMRMDYRKARNMMTAVCETIV